VSNEGDGEGAGADSDDSGTGLRVLRERLDVLYQGRAELALGPTGDGGYRVVLRLPLAMDPPGHERGDE
jgi:sensor histidine kinase YesM